VRRYLAGIIGSGPLPAAAIVLGLAAVFSAAALVVRPQPKRSALVVWTASPEVAEQFQQALAGEAVELMTARSLDLRLMTLLQTEGMSDHLPDVVHMDTLSAAKFLEGGEDLIGLLPLEDQLAASGLAGELSQPGIRAWTRDGHVYGIPFEIHPVTLTYRRDLFEAAGLDPLRCTTWDELADVLRKYCDYWEARGRPNRRALELARSRSAHLTLMLQQRGIDVIDERGAPDLLDPRIAETIAFCAELLAGERPVALPTSEGHGRWARDLLRGDVAMVWTPQWRLELLWETAPALEGELAMMPLPRFEPSDAQGVTWGGSVLAIPGGASDPQASWDLLRRLLRARSAEESPAAALIDGPVAEVYRELEQQVVPQQVGMLTLAAWGHLAVILSRSVHHLEDGGTADSLRQELAGWLAVAQRDLERRREFAS
jgi:ABC-type glycerol-3-phosphate transport system substrate-binding protein